jgi:enediyne biosynthesis protein E4
LFLKLIGNPAKKTPKDATGSKVFVTANGMRQRFDAISGASYASQSDQHISIGLGTATKIEKLEIQWAGGAVETINIAGVDRLLVVEEGKGIINK